MIEDTSSRPWATSEPPWAGALDKLAERAKAAQAGRARPARSPQIRASQLVEELEQTAAKFTTGAAFWYANDAAMSGQAGVLYDADHPHEPEVDEPELVPVDEVPNPLACQCGQAFSNELGLICHRAVYTDPNHENPLERMRRLLRAR